MKKIYTSLFCLLILSSLSAQFEGPKFIAPEIFKPRALATGDINNDGFVDIIVTAVGNNKVFWMKNLNGSGSFSQPLFINAKVSNPEAMVVADLNSDGDLDILVASRYSDQLLWFDNVDGQGDFKQKTIDGNFDDPRFIYAADIDGDGDPDVLSSSCESNKMVWYRNNGNGNFSEAILLTDEIVCGRQMYAADIDGDSDYDVVGVSHTFEGVLVWFENLDGQGTFGPKKIISSVNGSAHSVYAADIDGDTDIDIVFGMSSGRDLWWVENLDGEGTFDVPIKISPSVLGNTIRAVDIDADNDLDILTVHSLELIWFENLDGLGTFEERTIIDDNANNSVSAVSEDIDNDGDLDIVAIAATGNEVSWYENLDGNGNFGSANLLTSHGYSLDAIHVSDIDGDGYKDVLAGYFFDAKLTWYKNENGFGDFGSKTIISTQHDNVNDVTAGDLDQDGDQDIVAAFWLSDRVARYKNLDGNGNFSEQLFVYDVESPRTVKLSDLNNDGYPDLLFTGMGDVFYSLNDNVGTFPSPTILNDETNTSASSKLNVGDVDGDGDLDVIVGYYLFYDKIGWYENLDGNGNFGTENLIDGVNAKNIVAGDIDNDGDLDIAVSNYSNSFWYENLDGNGNFGTAIEITPSQFFSPQAMALSDIDLDGALDIIIVTEHNTYWIRNVDAEFNFNQRQNISDNGGDALFISDIDNDGDQDIVAEYGEFLVWYKNCFIVDEIYLDRWKVDLSPNPSKGNAKFEFDLSLIQNWKVRVYNSLGFLVLSQDAPAGGSSQGTVFLKNLTAGTYLISLKTDDRIETHNLVIIN